MEYFRFEFRTQQYDVANVRLKPLSKCSPQRRIRKVRAMNSGINTIQNLQKDNSDLNYTIFYFGCSVEKKRLVFHAKIN